MMSEGFSFLIAAAVSVAEYVSTLDLRDGCDTSQASMGNRSRSVPGLDVQVQCIGKIKFLSLQYCD